MIWRKKMRLLKSFNTFFVQRIVFLSTFASVKLSATIPPIYRVQKKMKNFCENVWRFEK